ncbi:hypothetical protein ABZ860_39455 [Microbispora sp. NPDC046973]|uniref:hypothetical protein n=1 Tax=Microbispora sp. NPDC046973 TaxID=3155022 RepID=UPI0033D8854A
MDDLWLRAGRFGVDAIAVLALAGALAVREFLADAMDSARRTRCVAVRSAGAGEDGEPGVKRIYAANCLCACDSIQFRIRA